MDRVARRPGIPPEPESARDGRATMIATVRKLRVALGLNIHKPLHFLAQAGRIYTGLDTNPSIFVAPNPPLPILLGQIQDATLAHQRVGQVKGAAAARRVTFGVLVTSLQCERMMVQTLCDQSPEQAAALIAAASMAIAGVGVHDKAILTLRNGLPEGTVLLDAHAGRIDGTRRRKLYNWRGTMDDGETFFALPPTPTGQTSVANLPRLTRVGFQVSVTVNKQPQGPWSETASILVL
jgi:hypothetical protein